MKKIIVMIQPFAMTQKVEGCENGYKFASVNSTVSNIPNDIFGIITTDGHYEDFSKITLVGPKKFTEKIVQKIKEKEMATYNKNNLEIEVF